MRSVGGVDEAGVENGKKEIGKSKRSAFEELGERIRAELDTIATGLGTVLERNEDATPQHDELDDEDDEVPQALDDGFRWAQVARFLYRSADGTHVAGKVGFSPMELEALEAALRELFFAIYEMHQKRWSRLLNSTGKRATAPESWGVGVGGDGKVEVFHAYTPHVFPYSPRVFEELYGAAAHENAKREEHTRQASGRPDEHATHCRKLATFRDFETALVGRATEGVKSFTSGLLTDTTAPGAFQHEELEKFTQKQRSTLPMHRLMLLEAVLLARDPAAFVRSGRPFGTIFKRYTDLVERGIEKVSLLWELRLDPRRQFRNFLGFHRNHRFSVAANVGDFEKGGQRIKK